MRLIRLFCFFLVSSFALGEPPTSPFERTPLERLLKDRKQSNSKWFDSQSRIDWILENDATGDATTFASTMNYGFSKYDDLGNINFTLDSIEALVYGAQNDASGFNIELLKHGNGGWAYSAGAFSPGSAPIVDFSSIYGAYLAIRTGEDHAFKKTGTCVFSNSLVPPFP